MHACWRAVSAAAHDEERKAVKETHFSPPEALCFRSMGTQTTYTMTHGRICLDTHVHLHMRARMHTYICTNLQTYMRTDVCMFRMPHT